MVELDYSRLDAIPENLHRRLKAELQNDWCVSSSPKDPLNLVRVLVGNKPSSWSSHQINIENTHARNHSAIEDVLETVEVPYVRKTELKESPHPDEDSQHKTIHLFYSDDHSFLDWVESLDISRLITQGGVEATRLGLSFGYPSEAVEAYVDPARDTGTDEYEVLHEFIETGDLQHNVRFYWGEQYGAPPTPESIRAKIQRGKHIHDVFDTLATDRPEWEWVKNYYLATLPTESSYRTLIHKEVTGKEYDRVGDVLEFPDSPFQ